MKKFLNKKIILLVICILVVISGIIAFCVNGFEKSIYYKSGTRIEIYIPSTYEKQDIIDIAKECFNTEEILFSEVEQTNQVAGIKITEYSHEQLENYKDKIAEKYKINKEEIECYEMVVPETSIATIINPYILPVILITVLTLIYIIIKNYKSNKKIKISLKVLGILVITLSVYFSIIVLFKLPFSIYTMPLALAIFIVTLLIAVNKKCE